MAYRIQHFLEFKGLEEKARKNQTGARKWQENFKIDFSSILKICNEKCSTLILPQLNSMKKLNIGFSEFLKLGKQEKFNEGIREEEKILKLILFLIQKLENGKKSILIFPLFRCFKTLNIDFP